LPSAKGPLQGWLVELGRLGEVVCVTAAENHMLEKLEHDSITGLEKYAAAGITFVASRPR
jgi:hypothetical protein